MDSVVRPSRVQNATILLMLTSVLDIYIGYYSFQFSIIYSDFNQTIVGTLMTVSGVLTFCASLIVWQQKPWATKLIFGIGVVVITPLTIFGYFLIAFILFAPIYWITIRWIRPSQPTNVPDWAPDWDED